MKAIFVVVLLLLSQQVFAGGAESHGGQVVNCPGQAPVVLDYWQSALPTMSGGRPDLIDLSKMSSDDVLALVKSRLSNSNLWHSYYRALELLGPESSWLESNLQNVQDSDPAYTLPPDCSLQQVAVRQDSTMYVDPTVLNNLSPAQQGILLVHEALYYVAQENGLSSSVEVRMVVRELLKKNLDQSALSKAVHQMGGTFFWWETYVGNGVYTGTYSGRTIGVFLNYDALLNGKQVEFLYYDSWSGPGEYPFQQPNRVECGDQYFSECHTVSGPKKCVLSDFGLSSFAMKCEDLDSSVRMSRATATSQ